MPYWEPRTQHWIGVVRVKGQPRRQKAFEKKADAKAWEADQRRNLQVEEMTATAFSDLYSEYLDYSKAKHSKKTYEEKVFLGRRFISLVGDPPSDQITTDTIQTFLMASREEASANRANKDRKNLLAFWAWAERIKDLPGNPVAKTEKFPHKRAAQYIPPESHILQILLVADRGERLFLNCYLLTAARRSSVFRWKWGEDIDFKLQKVRIGSAKTRDGSMEYLWLPVPGELMDELSWWYKVRPHRESEYVFTITKKGQWEGTPFVARRRFLAGLCKRAGVRPFGYHALRRYAATRLASGNVSMVLIQRVLGHKALSTTERYLGRSNEDLRATLEVLRHGDDESCPSFQPSFSPQNDG